MFYHNHAFYYYNHDVSFSSFLSILANLITIAGIIGLYIAWKQYKNLEKGKKKTKITGKLHLILAIKNQLAIIGEWTSYEGEGYSGNGKEWAENSQTQRANPFLMITDIDSVALQRVALLPTIQDLGKKTNEINEAIAQVNKWLTIFASYLTEIRAFKFSREPSKNIALSKKLKQGMKLAELDAGEERDFAEQLLIFQRVLHFDLISDEKGKKFHYWHKKLFQLINELEKEVEIEQKFLEI